MADQVALQAATGRELGSSSSRRLRAEGKIPAVVYGLNSEPTPISLDYGAARTALSTDAGLNALLNLEIDGNTELCLVKELQRHVVRDEVTHIDFIRVDPNADFELEVPLILVGEAKAVANVSGMVDQAMFALMITTKPTSIPNEIEVDITDMQVGDTIRVDMLNLPDGVVATDDPETAVATALVTRSTLEAMRAEDAEDAADAADAAGAAATEDAGDSDSDD